MTRSEFIDQWKHQLAGMILDAATVQRTGADLGLFCRNVIRSVDAKLGAMFDSLQPQPKPAPNGAAQPQRK